jgi:uncharacterized membrane protein YhaH (DUF805 family)
MSWFVLALKKYANFTGRSQRSEYWYFVLFYLLIFVALCLVDWLVGTFSPSNEIGLLSGIFSLAMIVPSIAVAARRLHDTDRSGWWQLLSLIPLIGVIVLIVFLAQDSKPGENKYGPNPKMIA